jgi:ATP-grasp domain, R2K clade family 3
MAAVWGDLMFSPDGTVATASDALEALDRAPLFVRPDEDSKSFDGGVFTGAAMLRAQLGSTPLETRVIVARARPVDAEWRCFVVNGSVIDSSEYRRAGRPSLHRGAPPRALELAERAAARWVPSDVTCIDIASSGDHFGIVEANCFNAARFYACDPATVIASVAQHVRSSFERR